MGGVGVMVVVQVHVRRPVDKREKGRWWYKNRSLIASMLLLLLLERPVDGNKVDK